LSAIARSCFLGRVAAREKCRDIRQQLQEARGEAAQREIVLAQLQQENQQLRKRNAELEAELARPRPATLPLGEAPPGMQYGAGLIELCVNLAREVGLRPAIRVLEVFFRWSQVKVAIPVYQALRTWMQRLGLYRMQNAPRADGGVWLTDHTNQIGKEKVLAVLRVPEKARFMNRAAMLRWANVVLWHWNHPQSQARRGITAPRLQEKLGWLRDFALQLRAWQACQEVIDTALTFLNQRGLFHGVTRQLRKLVGKFAEQPLSRRLVEALVKFVEGYEGQLQAREQLPMSTKILESCFAKYKQLEQQHSKGGFTSLLLTFPVLLRPTTAAEVTASMQRVKVADIRAWQQQHLPAAPGRSANLDAQSLPVRQSTPTASGVRVARHR
jgi:hypothetical protein